MILMATFSPVCLWVPSFTLEKWPVPSVSPISYSSVIAGSMSLSFSFSMGAMTLARSGTQEWGCSDVGTRDPRRMRAARHEAGDAQQAYAAPAKPRENALARVRGGHVRIVGWRA